MMTEEPHITIEQLMQRWPGMPYGEIAERVHYLVSGPGSPSSFPQPFMRHGTERLNPNTGNIVWDVVPLIRIQFNDDNTFDLDGTCFRLTEIEDYEKGHPYFFYQSVDANDLPGPAAPGQTTASEYISAEEARYRLQMSPVTFVRYLRDNRGALPLVGLSPNERNYFYSRLRYTGSVMAALEGYGRDPDEQSEGTPEEDAAQLLHQISIHRWDWEKHLNTIFAGPAEAEAPGAGEESLKARLAEVVAEGKTKQKQLETELTQVKQALAGFNLGSPL